MKTRYTIHRATTGDTMSLLVTRARMIGPERYVDVDQRGQTGMVRVASVARSASVLRQWRALVALDPAEYTLTRDRL